MHPSPSQYRQLQPEDRVTLASLRQQNVSMRAIARQLQRAPSTISRELQRNSPPSGYASVSAQCLALQRRRASRAAIKLHPESILFALVIELLRLRWSPEQIALTLARLYPKGHEHRVSHESIYNCIYAMPVGELRKELIATLRQAHNKRLPRSKGQDRRGQIPDMLSIHVRPPEIEDRQFPGHWEGDLIKGEGNASAVGTLVERTSRLVIAGQAATSQARQRRQCAAGLHRQALGHCAAAALEHDVRPGPGDGHAQEAQRANRHSGVLLRSAQPLAAWLQREHEWPGAPVPAQGYGSEHLQSGCCTSLLNPPGT